MEASKVIASMPFGLIALVHSNAPVEINNFLLRVPFTKEKMPWCPCSLKNQACMPNYPWLFTNICFLGKHYHPLQQSTSDCKFIMDPLWHTRTTFEKYLPGLLSFRKKKLAGCRPGSRVCFFDWSDARRSWVDLRGWRQIDSRVLLGPSCRKARHCEGATIEISLWLDYAHSS